MKHNTVSRLVTAIVFILLSGTLMALNRPTPAAGPEHPDDSLRHRATSHHQHMRDDPCTAGVECPLRQDPAERRATHHPPGLWDDDPLPRAERLRRQDPAVQRPDRPSAMAGHTMTGGVDTAWVRHYASGLLSSSDQAKAMAVDADGNIYVTGYGDSTLTEYDYVTIKYDPSGVEQWAARYNGPGNSDDLAKALAVDGAGNVYVTGNSYGSGTRSDYATIKYGPDGTELWVARYNGPENSLDGAAALAVDGSGNVYVTGSSVGSDMYDDYATIKYDPDGVQQWVARYGDPGDGSDKARALAVDGTGNVYVTGSSKSSDTRHDYATVKYSPDGIELWVTRYNGPVNSHDYARALAVDGSGNVYVTGYSYGSGTGDDYATVKYNTDGAELWAARYNGPYDEYSSNGDYARALAVDGSGNVYVTGYSEDYYTGDDYATVKYDPDGVQQWVARYDGPVNGSDNALALAVDGAGNIYVTGTSDGSGTYDDYATVKYGPDGAELWVARYDGLESSSDYAYALAVDGSGNVYVTGCSEGSVTGTDYATVKYGPNGVQQWVARYDGPESSWDYAYALAVDGSGNVYVTGSSESSGTGYDYATVKYGPDGAELWVARYNRQDSSRDNATALALDGSGNVYVTGTSQEGYDGSAIYVTIKYFQTATGIVTEENPAVPTHFSLHQNYPNPFNPATSIHYDLPHRAVVTLAIYDILGREVARLVDGSQHPGYHQVVWNGRTATGREATSGIYIARLMTPEFTQHIRIVLLR